MKLVFATHNKNKLFELQKLMPSTIKLVSLDDIDCFEDIPETSDSLEGNADLKSKYILDKFKLDCFADDTGLEIEALGGEPGVKSARYANETEKSDQKNMALVLRNLEHKNNRNAQFRTVISLRLNGVKHQFEGIAKGHISTIKHGEKGFGYDPIFIPQGFEKSFAEMTMEEKNLISHRGKAVRQLIDFLKLV